MAVTKCERLEHEGYQLYAIQQIGLPHFVWRCSIDLIHDRTLSLTEETLLGLVNAGAAKREVLTSLMGVEESFVTSGVVRMLERHALEYDQDGQLRLSTDGARMLAQATARVTTRLDEQQIRHDPYRNELRWYKPEYDLRIEQAEAAGILMLGRVPSLDPTEVEVRYKEVEDLIRSGVPSLKGRRFAGKVEVLRLQPLGVETVYRPVDLEVWFKRETHTFSWRMVRDSREETEAIEFFEALEAGGYKVIGEEPAPGGASASPAGSLVHEAAEVARREVPATILRTGDFRKALRQAIEDANRAIYIISPWLSREGVDQDLTRWIDQALLKKRNLRVYIGFGFDDHLPTLPSRKRDRKTRDALDHLSRLGQKHGGRVILKEIGNTHEKVLVVDDSYGFVGSFNWLSWNPDSDDGRGVRSEMGARVTGHGAMEELLRRIASAFSTEGG